MSNATERRRILLAVTGLTPQVVTETLYVLACAQPSGWIPHEIHLITTATGAENARLNLLHADGWFHRLCRDYQLPPIDFPVANIHIVCDAEHSPLDDIRTQQQNTLAADFITGTVRALTEDDNSELHVSIAGGRKTMGYYLGYALSLYGRPQDRLSHVLVSDPYETNRDFYYPTPYDHPIHTRRGDKEITVDARNARVELASIPFVRLRDDLPARLLNGQASLSEIVAIANRSLGAAHLLCDIERREIYADGQRLPLSQTQFLVFYWMAERAKAGEDPIAFASREAIEAFLDLIRRVFSSMSSEYERIEGAFDWRREAPIRIAKYFEPHKSDIHKALVETLGKKAASRYEIKRFRHQGVARFGLVIEPEQIELRGA